MAAGHDAALPRIAYRITDEYAIVRRPGSPTLYLEWREGGRPVRRSTGHSELEPAKRRCRELILEHATIQDAAPEEALASAVIERYYLRHGAKLASKDTAKRAQKLWAQYFPMDTVADITPDRQRRFQDWLTTDQGLSIGYARRILGVGKAAFNQAWQEGEIRQVPFIKLPPNPAGFPHYARFEDLVRLLNAPMPDHLFTYCMIRLNTGCRGDAARDLAPAQVDFHHGLLDLNPAGRQQTKKFRAVVPLSAFLRAYLGVRPDRGPYVHWHGKRLQSIKNAWAKVQAEAGLPEWFIPKILRHTVGTELRRRKVAGWDVSAFLGHKKGESAPTTENYAKFDPDYLAGPRDAIDAWMVELAARVPRMKAALDLLNPSDASAMPLRVGGVAGGATETLVPSRFPVVGGTGFEPVTPTMSRYRNLRLIK
ncbi:MAG TPA: tyrosine-type recombinase/integrase [Pseudoxanthomonas sp.]